MKPLPALDHESTNVTATRLLIAAVQGDAEVFALHLGTLRAAGIDAALGAVHTLAADLAATLVHGRDRAHIERTLLAVLHRELGLTSTDPIEGHER